MVASCRRGLGARGRAPGSAADLVSGPPTLQARLQRKTVRYVASSKDLSLVVKFQFRTPNAVFPEKKG